MKNQKTQDSLFLIAGALLGAAAMYLLDPELGQRRRRHAATAAEDAYERARRGAGSRWGHLTSRANAMADRAADDVHDWRHSVSDSAHSVMERAREAAHDLAERARSGGSHLRDWGSHVWDRARGLAGKIGGSLSHRAHDLHEGLAHRAEDARDWVADHTAQATGRVRSWLGHEERHEGFGAGTVITSTISCCVVGAGAMYFLDSSQGRARRTHLRERVGDIVRDTGRAMRSIGHELGDRARRLFGRSRDAAGARRQRLDSGDLVTRIRGELGRLSPYADQVQIMADADGTITLTGQIDRHELDGLLTMVHHIPGVNHVINRIEIGEPARSEWQTPASEPATR